MNFFLDHDVPADVGRVLRLKGHTVELLEEALPKRTDDLELAGTSILPEVAAENRRYFVTIILGVREMKN